MQSEVGSAQSVENEMIEGVRARIEAWRRSEEKSRSMPEELWEGASAAAQRLGVWRVSRALSLNYRSLKRRAQPDEAQRAPARGADFIELNGLAGFREAAADEAVVEVLATDGAKLTVRVPAARLNIAALASEFRGRS